MYLLDTSVMLELLLDQEKADDVERSLRSAPPDSLHVSDFSLHSLGVVLVRRKRHDILLRAVEDMLLIGGVEVVRLEVEHLQEVVEASQRFGLDFDDAYQYAAAAKYGLTIMSFDGDFDRTERGRKTPAQVLGG